MMRRTAMLWAAMAMIAANPADAADSLVVRTTNGPVSGAAEGAVLSWKGIPYAAPPVSALRWRAPQPAQRWAATRTTTAYSHDCMQLPFPSDAAPLGTEPAEDCLYANVWKPKTAKAKLPVIFWIYGGGFVNGGSSPPTYSGAELAKRGVLVVSFNYRLGRFGFFPHPALTADAGNAGGNFAFLDQVAALDWARRNVAAFGGDPDNVTVVGESAGGMSVHFLLTSPKTQGWFQRAVIMSGGDVTGMPGANRSVAVSKAVAFAEGKGVPSGDPQAAAKLRALAPDQVVDGLNLASFFDSKTYGGPTPDGQVSVDLAAAYAAGRYNHVPVMVGATSNDIGGPGGFMIGGARSIAGLMAKANVPVYDYRFSYVAQSVTGKAGADHASDIPFFFDTQAVKYGAETTLRDNGMGRTIADYLVNFARTGDPNGKGLPAWPRYDPAANRIMDFAAGGIATPGLDPLAATAK